MADVQLDGSDVAGVVPPSGLAAYSLWINPTDRQLWMVDTTNTANAAVAVRAFSTSANYAVDDMVVFGGEIWRCTTTHTAASWNVGHFVQLTSIGGRLTPNPDALIVAPPDYATNWLAGITSAVVRLFGTTTANQTLVHLGARGATQKFVQLVNSLKAIVATVREATTNHLIVEMWSETGVGKFFATTKNSDAFLVVGGGQNDRAAARMLTVIGDTKLAGALEVTGDFVGASTAGEWTNPVKLGPEATPVFLWGNDSGRLVYKSLVAPTSISDGVVI